MQRYSVSRILLFAQAFILLGSVRLMLLVLPFRRIARLWGLTVVEVEPQDSLTPLPGARRVAWAVRAAARRTPWESKCLAQALVGAWMLRRRNIGAVLYLGMARDPANPRNMLAHAWLRSGDFILTGGQGHQQYTVVARFLVPVYT